MASEARMTNQINPRLLRTNWRFQLQDIQGWIDEQKAGAQSAARKREK
jgi:hypothetical protein